MISISEHSFESLTEQELLALDGGVGWKEWVGEAVGYGIAGGTVGALGGPAGAASGAITGVGYSLYENAKETW
ncbi:Blp family class II bacteriocin [Gracilibacillus lacisalsi]|uniref:Blp family class II bacteriocin n=1 Tax=Gracilibacillus lacisalsi TaxID=393087 RepID=UPI000368F304|nr:Blp family class II bacteriocin [Gracilibacillus lacisalsi]